MGVTVEVLNRLARVHVDAGRIALLKTPNVTDPSGTVCWAQEVAPPDATAAQRTAIKTRLLAAVATASTVRAWINPITIEEERDELGRHLWTIYVFKAG